MKAATRRLTA